MAVLFAASVQFLPTWVESTCIYMEIGRLQRLGDTAWGAGDAAAAVPILACFLPLLRRDQDLDVAGTDHNYRGLGYLPDGLRSLSCPHACVGQHQERARVVERIGYATLVASALDVHVSFEEELRGIHLNRRWLGRHLRLKTSPRLSIIGQGYSPLRSQPLAQPIGNPGGRR